MARKQVDTTSSWYRAMEAASTRGSNLTLPTVSSEARDESQGQESMASSTDTQTTPPQPMTAQGGPSTPSRMATSTSPNGGQRYSHQSSMHQQAVHSAHQTPSPQPMAAHGGPSTPSSMASHSPPNGQLYHHQFSTNQLAVQGGQMYPAGMGTFAPPNGQLNNYQYPAVQGGQMIPASMGFFAPTNGQPNNHQFHVNYPAIQGGQMIPAGMGPFAPPNGQPNNHQSHANHPAGQAANQMLFPMDNPQFQPGMMHSNASNGNASFTSPYPPNPFYQVAVTPASTNQSQLPTSLPMNGATNGATTSEGAASTALPNAPTMSAEDAQRFYQTSRVGLAQAELELERQRTRMHLESASQQKRVYANLFASAAGQEKSLKSLLGQVVQQKKEAQILKEEFAGKERELHRQLVANHAHMQHALQIGESGGIHMENSQQYQPAQHHQPEPAQRRQTAQSVQQTNAQKSPSKIARGQKGGKKANPRQASSSSSKTGTQGLSHMPNDQQIACQGVPQYIGFEQPPSMQQGHPRAPTDQEIANQGNPLYIGFQPSTNIQRTALQYTASEQEQANELVRNFFRTNRAEIMANIPLRLDYLPQNVVQQANSQQNVAGQTMTQMGTLQPQQAQQEAVQEAPHYQAPEQSASIQLNTAQGQNAQSFTTEGSPQSHDSESLVGEIMTSPELEHALLQAMEEFDQSQNNSESTEMQTEFPQFETDQNMGAQVDPQFDFSEFLASMDADYLAGLNGQTDGAQSEAQHPQAGQPVGSPQKRQLAQDDASNTGQNSNKKPRKQQETDATPSQADTTPPEKGPNDDVDANIDPALLAQSPVEDDSVDYLFTENCDWPMSPSPDADS